MIKENFGIKDFIELTLTLIFPLTGIIFGSFEAISSTDIKPNKKPTVFAFSIGIDKNKSGSGIRDLVGPKRDAKLVTDRLFRCRIVDLAEMLDKKTEN